MSDFDVNRYRASLHEKLDNAYESLDIVVNSNIGPNARPVVIGCLQDYITMLNRKLFFSFDNGDKNVSSPDAGSF